eukprot:474076-Rhodomonas_salina.1
MARRRPTTTSVMMMPALQRLAQQRLPIPVLRDWTRLPVEPQRHQRPPRQPCTRGEGASRGPPQLGSPRRRERRARCARPAADASELTRARLAEAAAVCRTDESV